jgi:hypothetical protein
MNKKIYIYRWAHIGNSISNRGIFYIGHPEDRNSIRCTTEKPGSPQEAALYNQEMRELAAQVNCIDIRSVMELDNRSDAQPQLLPPNHTAQPIRALRNRRG